MPSSRGSCSGSGVLLELCLKNIAPAAIIFHEAEEILSLGALVAERIFNKPIPIIKLQKQHYLILRKSSWAKIHRNRLQTDSFNFELTVIKQNTCIYQNTIKIFLLANMEMLPKQPWKLFV